MTSSSSLSPARGETYLFCPPNRVVKYVPLPDLAIWREQPATDKRANP
jgi:hypothetical protein